MAWQPIGRVDCLAHVVMICGGKAGGEGWKGAKGDNFPTMQIVASYGHGGCHRPTAKADNNQQTFFSTVLSC